MCSPSQRKQRQNPKPNIKGIKTEIRKKPFSAEKNTFIFLEHTE